MERVRYKINVFGRSKTKVTVSKNYRLFYGRNYGFVFVKLKNGNVQPKRKLSETAILYFKSGNFVSETATFTKNKR